MKIQTSDDTSSSLAAAIAPEDLRCGDFVAVLNEIVELPSFYWCDTLTSERDELIRIRYLPTNERLPYKIKAICLPFVFAKSPRREHRTFDVRLTTLVRLEQKYARTVWKALKPRPPRPVQTT